MNSKHPSQSRFWSGLAMGGAAGTILFYLFATRRGRALLKKLLEATEGLEDNAADIIEIVMNEFKPPTPHNHTPLTVELPQPATESSANPLIKIIQKIKAASVTGGAAKRYFVKD